MVKSIPDGKRFFQVGGVEFHPAVKKFHPLQLVEATKIASAEDGQRGGHALAC